MDLCIVIHIFTMVSLTVDQLHPLVRSIYLEPNVDKVRDCVFRSISSQSEKKNKQTNKPNNNTSTVLCKQRPFDFILLNDALEQMDHLNVVFKFQRYCFTLTFCQIHVRFEIFVSTSLVLTPIRLGLWPVIILGPSIIFANTRRNESFVWKSSWDSRIRPWALVIASSVGWAPTRIGTGEVIVFTCTWI